VGGGTQDSMVMSKARHFHFWK